MGLYLSSWLRVFIFSGRAGRTECWVFLIGNLLLAFAILNAMSSAQATFTSFAIAVTALVLAQLSVITRRLHDIDRKGSEIVWCLLAPPVLGILSFKPLAAMLLFGTIASAVSDAPSPLWLVAMAAGVLIGCYMVAGLLRMTHLLLKPGSTSVNPYGPAKEAVPEGNSSLLLVDLITE